MLHHSQVLLLLLVMHSYMLLLHLMLQNHLLWFNLLAVIISLSGLRRFLDPASPAFQPAVGWVSGVLDWFSRCTVALLLFSNGAWICGKDLWSGNMLLVSRNPYTLTPKPRGNTA